MFISISMIGACLYVCVSLENLIQKRCVGLQVPPRRNRNSINNATMALGGGGGGGGASSFFFLYPSGYGLLFEF
jgi:hypothetical protein